MDERDAGRTFVQNGLPLIVGLLHGKRLHLLGTGAAEQGADKGDGRHRLQHGRSVEREQGFVG